MPLYNYICDSCGWTKDKIFRASSRPSEINCGSCEGTAQYKFSVSKHQNSDAKFITPKYSSEKLGLSMHQFKCNECDHIFDEIIDHGKGQSVDDSFECPECGAANCSWKPSVQIDRWSEQFPYYDRGLGVMLQSKAHRRQICKERGLTPVDGDFDEEKLFSDQTNRRESEEKEYNDYVDRLDNAPEFREYRRALDQGRF